MEADIAITVSIAVVACFLGAQLLRTIRTFSVQKTLREALARGTPISPELFADMERSAPTGANDMRSGMVLIALALAIAGFGLIQGSTDAVRGMTGISLFPLFVGIALLLRLKIARREGDA
jgi:hypothetical protein